MESPPYLKKAGRGHRIRKQRDNRKVDQSKIARYQGEDGIVRFATEVLGIDLAPYQEDILRNFVKHRRAAVRAPHGAGKTAISAVVILWGATCNGDDVKVVTTAGAWRQLTYFTWPEVRKWARKAKWELLGINMRDGRELLRQSIVLPGVEAFPVASDNPALIEGAHAKVIIYVFDEAKAIPAETFDAAEGAFSTDGNDPDSKAYALAISTPGDTQGRFYQIHKREAGYEDWWVRHISLKEAIAAGRIGEAWAEQRKRQWGEKSAIYQNRVEGEFAEQGDDVLIPLWWVEKAVERWHTHQERMKTDAAYAREHRRQRKGLAVDVARQGIDKSTVAEMQGRVIESVTEYAKPDTMALVGYVASRTDRKTPIIVDEDGIGGGVYDRFKERKYRVIGFKNGEKTNETDKTKQFKFANKKAAAWWLMREALDPEGDDPIAIPDIDLLIGDLTAPLWTFNSSGKVEIEKKEDVRKRLGRSTDYGDSAIMVNYGLYSKTARRGGAMGIF
jgi:hypothetical protein